MVVRAPDRPTALFVGLLLLGVAGAQDYYGEQETLTVATTVGGVTNAELDTPTNKAAIRTQVAASFNRSESKVLVRVTPGTTTVIAIVTFPRGAAEAAKSDIDAAALGGNIHSALAISGITVPVPTVEEDIEVVLGAYGPITSMDKNWLATLIVFDLDFRANYDAEIQARIGNPMMHIENINPRLRLRLQVGNSHSDSALGLHTAIDFWWGKNGLQAIMGLIGGYHSAISMPVASLGNALKKTQVSFGSTSSQLSQKSSYGYFFRTIPEDSIQSRALWQWIVTFRVPKVLSLYANDGSYAYGLHEGVTAYAVAAEQLWKIQSIPVEVPIYDMGVCRSESSRKAATTIARISGRKFIMALMVVTDWGCFTEQAMAAGLHGEGVTDHQWIGSEAISAHLPAGFMQFLPQNRDPVMWPRFSERWSRLSESDISGSASQSYYKVDMWSAPWSSDQENYTFDSGVPDPSLEGPFAFDAGYTFMYAFNKLLENYTLNEINAIGSEALLLEQLRRTDFAGLSGTVSFNDKQDRLGDYRLMNMRNCTWDAVVRGCLRDETLTLEQVGMFHCTTDAMELTQNLTWAPGVELCPDGTFDCVPCPPDQVFVDSIGTCVCKAGHYQEDGVCIECGAGHFSVAPGSRVCEECAPGRFASQRGFTECARCPVGTYASSPGNGNCTSCPSTFTTAGDGNEVSESCLCGVGSRLGPSGVCEDCGDARQTGLVCPGGGVVQVSSGFYAADASMSMFKCYGSTPLSRCQGGEPGVGSCAAGREGIACSECVENFKETSDGSCTPCGDGNSGVAGLVAGCFLLVAGLTALYLVISRRNGKSDKHSALITIELVVGMAFVVVQQFSIVGMFEEVRWSPPMVQLMRSLQLVALNFDVLGINCVVKLSPLARFISSNMVFVVCVVVLWTVHMIFVALFHKGDLLKRQPWFTACIGTVFRIFYISVVSSVLEPLQCLHNPNGQLTNRQYPSVICWNSEEHRVMVVISIVVLLVPLGYLARCCHLVLRYPAAIAAGRVDYLIAYSFMFSRYKPKMYWYALVQLFRSLAFAALPTVPSVAFQLLGMMLVLSVQLIVTATLLPWRIDNSNYMELFFTILMQFVLAAGGLYVDIEPDVHLSWVCFLLVVASFLVVPVVVLFCLYRYLHSLHRKSYDYFLCHHKARAGAFARLMKMTLQRKDITVFVDCDNLTDLDGLFDQVGNLTKTFVLICSQGLVSRVWCVGEICTAKAKGLDVVRLQLPCYSDPSEIYIRGLDKDLGDLPELTSRGITVEAAQEALRWTCWQRAIVVPQDFRAVELWELARQVRRGNNAPRGAGSPTDFVWNDGPPTTSEDPHEYDLAVTPTISEPHERPVSPTASTLSPKSPAKPKLWRPTEGACTDDHGASALGRGMSTLSRGMSTLSPKSPSTRLDRWRTTEGIGAEEPAMSRGLSMTRKGSERADCRAECPHASSASVILHDEKNTEATASAMVLAHMLRHHFHDRPDDLPVVLEIDEQLPIKTHTVVLICTRGALEQERILRALKRAMDLETKCLPIVAEEGFQFPVASFDDDHRDVAALACFGTRDRGVASTPGTPASGASSNESPEAAPEALLAHVRGVFKTIALQFLASTASEAVLKTSADQVARRLRSSRATLY